VLARVSSGVGGAVMFQPLGRMGYSSSIGSSGPSYPSPVDNGLMIDLRTLIVEANNAFSNPIRGHLRGVATPLAILDKKLHLQTIANLDGSSAEYLCVSHLYNGSPGLILFDITGPWG